MRRIIVEGPDGSGKTTLVNQLVIETKYKRAPRFSHSTGGPMEFLYEATITDMKAQRSERLIYDRYPSISEPIYATTLEGRTLDKRFHSPEYIQARQKFYTHAHLIICLPPFEVVKSMVQSSDQLEGVKEKIAELYGSYDIFAATIERIFPGKLTVYDRTRDKLSELLKEINS